MSQGGNSNSSGGGGGPEQSHYHPESKNNNEKSLRERLLYKPSDDTEINTAEEAINHIEQLKERENNLRILVAKGSTNISRDVRLRDLDISFKKPLTPIAKYLDNCRKNDDP
jgi:hypothetical protein